MDLQLTEEQQILRDQLRGFAREELMPAAADIDEKARFPSQQVARMGELGLMGIAVSPDYGGAGMDNVAYAVAMEEISAGCASCGVIMSVNNSLFCWPVEKYGTEDQKRRWLEPVASGREIGCYALSEPGTGSDAAAQQTVATRDGKNWLINGTKNFITNGAEASACVLFAMGDKSKGVKGINAYIVPKDVPGYRIVKNEKKLGIKGTSTSQILLEDVRLGPEHMLGKEGEGFKIAMSTLDGGRLGIAGQAIGIARAAMEGARGYALERNAFGGPIANLQAIQFMLADMGTEIDAARLLLWRASNLKDKGLPYSRESAMAKLYAAEMSNRVTNKALQVYGGFGYCKDFPAERHLRDARITEIYEGTSEIQRLVIARSLLADK